MTEENDFLAHFVERSFRAALHPCVYPHIQHHPALESLRRDMLEATLARHGALAEVVAAYRWEIHAARDSNQDDERILSRAMLDEARAGQNLLDRNLPKASIWISSIGPDREAMAIFAATMAFHPSGIYDYIDVLTPFMDRVPKTAILQAAAMRRSQLLDNLVQDAMQSDDPFLRALLRGRLMDIAQEKSGLDFWATLYQMTGAYWSAQFARDPDSLRDGIPFQDAAWLLHSAAQFGVPPVMSARGVSGSSYRNIVERLARERVAFSQPLSAK